MQRGGCGPPLPSECILHDIGNFGQRCAAFPGMFHYRRALSVVGSTEVLSAAWNQSMDCTRYTGLCAVRMALLESAICTCPTTSTLAPTHTIPRLLASVLSIILVCFPLLARIAARALPRANNIVNLGELLCSTRFNIAATTTASANIAL